MKVYVTSKNSGPSMTSEYKYVLYIGGSEQKAIEAIGDFLRYERLPIEMESMRLPYLYSAVPQDQPREWVKFCFADGWWYSVVSIDVEEQ